MTLSNQNKYTFISKGLSKETFTVVRFQGSEGLSRCYQFDIEIVSRERNLPLEQIMKNPAVFTILRPKGEAVYFHGFLTHFEQRHAFQEYVFYQARLAPRLWWLSLAHQNQVFLDMTVPEILAAVFQGGGLHSLDFELRLQNNYPKWDFVCQYDESLLQFACRWMEREGIYFYFEQTEQGETVILTDTKIAHTEMPEGKTFHYAPPSGLDYIHRDEVVHQLICRQQMTPQNVVLVDYNYEKPSLTLKAEAEVDPDLGRGEDYLYGEHFRTQEEGKQLAAIRAEEHLCRRSLFLGESSVPFARPGYTFNLIDHYREEFNQRYLFTEVEHQGSQVFYLAAGLQAAFPESENRLFYFNSFTAIPSHKQFRPPRVTPKARFHGVLNAKIDAAGEGKIAHVDEQGRYKVILPFDRSGREEGTASAWIRMAQPYAGSDHGFHFPLHKEAEVLLSFIDGDPDRPIIAAAVPNPHNPSPVNRDSQTMAKITTAGQNKIHIEDAEGNQRIFLQSPTDDTWLRMGAPNDPEIKSYDSALLRSSAKNPKLAWETAKKWLTEGWTNFKKSGYFFSSKSWFAFDAGGGKIEVQAGAGKVSIVLAGGKVELSLDGSLKGNVGLSFAFNTGAEVKVDLTKSKKFALEDLKAGLSKIEAFGKKIIGLGSKTQVSGNKNDLSTNTNNVTGAKLDVATSQTDVIATQQKLLTSKVEANTNEIKTLANKLDALAIKVGCHSTLLNSTATEIKSNATTVSNEGTKVNTTGTKIENIGPKINNSAIDINNSSSVIIQN